MDYGELFVRLLSGNIGCFTQVSFDMIQSNPRPKNYIFQGRGWEWFPLSSHPVEAKNTAIVCTCKPEQGMSIQPLCSPWGLQWWSSGHLRWNAGDSIKDSGYGPQTNLLWQTGGVLLFPDPVMNRGLESPMLSCQSGAETDWEGADSRLMLQASCLSSKTHRISPLALLPFDYHFTQAAAPTFRSKIHPRA